MEKEKLQRLGWSVPHLRSLVVVDGAGAVTDSLGSADPLVSLARIDRTLRTLDAIGAALALGPIASVGAHARGATAVIVARDRARIVGVFGGEVKDIEHAIITIAEQLAP